MLALRLVTSPYIDYGSWLNEGVEPRFSPYMSIGLLSLASSTRNKGYEVDVFDINSSWNIYGGPGSTLLEMYEASSEAILRDAPIVVGFMTEYYTYHHVLAVAAQVKAKSPDTIIVFGGPQATVTDIATMKNYAVPDIIVRGEAEDTISDLLDAISQKSALENVRGITYRDPTGIKRSLPRPLLEDLDMLPMPAFDLVEIQRGDLVMIEAGRGCPFACAFCSTNDFWHRRYRMKSPGRIVAEMQLLSRLFNVHDVSLIHDCLTANKREVLSLCDAIKTSGIDIRWGCSSRTDTVDYELLNSMAAAGCTHIYFGMETGDAEMQKRINKNLDLDRSFDVIRHARSLGIEVTTPFMMGFPGETDENISSTFNTIYRALSEDVYLVQIFATAPYGGTPLLTQHFSDIQFSPHFIDAVMSPNERQARDRTFVASPEIFSGHFRFTTNSSIDLRGIDQFFPMINEMRYTVISLWRELNDPTLLYKQWLAFLEEKSISGKTEGTGDRFSSTPRYGTFQDFGNFLSALVADISQEIPYISELLDYERTRLDLAAAAMRTGRDYYNPHLSRNFQRDGDRFRVRLAPNVAVKNYHYDIPLIIDELSQGITPTRHRCEAALAIVAVNERAVNVLRLSGLAGEIAFYCEQGMILSEIIYRVQRRIESSGGLLTDDDSMALERSCITSVTSLESASVIRITGGPS